MDDTQGPDPDRLFELASEQAGYFTTAQARRCGYGKALLAHHARPGGRFLRVRRGLYRLRQYPSSPREDVIAAWLAVGPEEAVVSHESALEILGLSDVVPEAVQITVPRSKRYRSAPRGVRIHTTTRRPDPTEVTVRAGIPVTGPVRSILDCAEAGLAPEHVIAATRQALERGLITRRQIVEAARRRPSRVSRLIAQALEAETA